MKKSKFSESQIVNILKEAEAGVGVLATLLSTLVYWKKLYHFQTYEKEEIRPI